MDFKLKPAQYIAQDAQLKTLVNHLRKEPVIGIDTESNSMHAYRERTCLIQLSTRSQDYLIDPFTIQNMAPLGEIFADPTIQKVFHAAEYDLLCLRRDFHYQVENLFDTMLAARICGFPQMGLNHLLERYFGITLDKKHQLDDWGERPLGAESLRYAQMDSHFLPELRDIFYNELKKRERLVEAEEIFSELAHDTREHNGRSFDQDGFWKIGQPHSLNPYQMATLREVYFVREEIASELNKPPFKVISSHGLVMIAKGFPKTLRALSEVHGLSSMVVRLYGELIIEAVKRSRNVKLTTPPSHSPPPPEVTDLYIALHTWRKETAQQRGVEADVILSKHVLWELAHHAPDNLQAVGTLTGLGAWRLEHYGNQLVNVIQTFKSRGG